MKKSLSGSNGFVGAAYALGAFLLWGLLPIYWKAFGATPAIEIFSHRVVWSLVFLMAVLFLQRKWHFFLLIFQDRKSLKTLTLTALIICINWITYIWAVNSGHIIETSLGYFITPLMNVLLGVFLLKEKLNFIQKLAVLLAFIGVARFVLGFGDLPWIGLLLSFSFASYGYLRKIVAVESLVALTYETIIITPFCLIYIGYLLITGQSTFLSDHHFDILFLGTGVATAIPLVWFACAARKLKLSTLAFFQYLAPSCQLAVGVFIYHESFTTNYFITFSFIWSALIIYTYDSINTQRKRRLI